MRLLLSMGLKPGGYARAPLRPHLRILDTDTGSVTDPRVETTPRHHPSPDDHAEFTGAVRTPDGHLLQTTRTEVLWLRWPDLTVVRRWSHPLLYDVHDALPRPGGGWAVTATGHDSVLEFDAGGRLQTHHWLAAGRVGQGAPPPGFLEAHDGVTDFRTVPFVRFKPHAVHPNHLVDLDGSLWVTSLRTRRFHPVDDPQGGVVFDQGPPHDGIRWHDGLWFTTISGHVVVRDPHTLAVTRDLDLSALATHRRMQGWCRGLARVGSRLFVGMTILRGSTQRELIRWLVKGEAGRKAPTRVVEVDLDTERIVAEHPVGNVAGGTIYSLHPLDGP